MNQASGFAPVARMPELKGPPMMTPMPFCSHSGRKESSDSCSSRVWRPASRKEFLGALRAGSGTAMGEDVDVMAERDIDAVKPQAFEREVQRAHDAVVGIVVAHLPRRDLEELADAVAQLRRTALQDPADLGRQHEVVAGHFAQERACSLVMAW